MPTYADDDGARIGRARATTHAEISHMALRLFIANGFDDTTVDDVARAVGISRRTLFRYFASKNDLPWGEFDKLLDQMRIRLATAPDDVSLREQMRQAILEFNRVPSEEASNHRGRMELLLKVPTLAAYSTLRYRAWRQVLAEHIGNRLDLAAGDLVPQTVAWIYLGVCLAAYEHWLAHPEADLNDLLSQGLRVVGGQLDMEVPAQNSKESS